MNSNSRQAKYRQGDNWMGVIIILLPLRKYASLL